MKKLHFITLAAAAALTAACSSTETVYEYVRLSDAACTFLASDNTQKEHRSDGIRRMAGRRRRLMADRGTTGRLPPPCRGGQRQRNGKGDRNRHHQRQCDGRNKGHTDGTGEYNIPLPRPQDFRYGSGHVQERTLRRRQHQGTAARRDVGKLPDHHRPRNRRMDTARSLSQQSLQHRTALRHLRRRDDILPGCQHQRMRRLQPRGRLLSARQCRGARTPALGTEHLGRRPHLGRLGAG